MTGRVSSVAAWLDAAAAPGSEPAAVIQIAVPKRIVRLATRRNRIKRMIREVLRREHSLNDATVYRFKVRRAPTGDDYETVRRAVAAALK